MSNQGAACSLLYVTLLVRRGAGKVRLSGKRSGAGLQETHIKSFSIKHHNKNHARTPKA